MSARSLIVPTKSFAIWFLTGYVWQPMGIPSGLARSPRTTADRHPAAATFVAVLVRNCLLEVIGIRFSFVRPAARRSLANIVSQCTFASACGLRGRGRGLGGRVGARPAGRA